MADSEKTEKATPKRRRDERKKGNVFFSNDIVAVATLVGSCAMLYLTLPGMARRIYSFVTYCLNLAATEPIGGVMRLEKELLVQMILLTVQTVGPLLAVTAVMAVVATFFQTKMLFAMESIKPNFGKLNPLEGFKRLFSARSLVEALKGVLKISILLYLLYSYLVDMTDEFPKLLYTDLPAACRYLLDSSFGLMMRIGLAFVVLAAADAFYQWWDFERRIRMSKQEIKEEYKQTEGDPQIKGKIKEAQRKMAQSRMMQQVPQADVVIKNPTHFAVALRYKPETDPAPVVLAKGQDELALRIIRVAEEHKVTVVENVPLARALYATTDLEQQIPPELYNAVAEVLVYLYRLDQKASKRER